MENLSKLVDVERLKGRVRKQIATQRGQTRLHELGPTHALLTQYDNHVQELMDILEEAIGLGPADEAPAEPEKPADEPKKRPASKRGKKAE